MLKSTVSHQVHQTNRDFIMIQEDEDLKIDENLCLRTLQKIKQGDLSSFSKIDDIKTYIQNLKYEIRLKSDK